MAPASFRDLVPIYASGGTLSVVLMLTLSAIWIFSPTLRHDHSSQMIQMLTLCDLVYTLKYTIGALAWTGGYNDETRSLNIFEDNCMISTLWGQIVGMASISFNAAWIVDFIGVIRKPLRSTGSGANMLRLYLTGVVTLCVGAAVFNVIFPTPVAANCWVRPHSTYFEVILTMFLIIALLSFVYAAVLLWKDGAFRALRLALLRRHAAFIAAFVLMWSWPLLHRAIDPNAMVTWLTYVDAVNACGQAGVLALVRLSEVSVRRRLVRRLTVCFNCMLRRGEAVSNARISVTLRAPLLRTQSSESEMTPMRGGSVNRASTDVHEETEEHTRLMVEVDANDASIASALTASSPRARDAVITPLSTPSVADDMFVKGSGDSSLRLPQKRASLSAVPRVPAQVKRTEEVDGLMTLTAQLRQELVACLLSGVCQSVGEATSMPGEDRVPVTINGAAHLPEAPSPPPPLLLSLQRSVSLRPLEELQSPALAQSHVGASKARLRTSATVLRRLTKLQGSGLYAKVGIAPPSSVASEGSAGSGAVGAYELASYEEARFTRVRAAAGVHPARVLASFDPVGMHTGDVSVRFSEGASASFFCRSRDGRLLLKTIELREVNALLGIASTYSRTVADGHDSLLCRFLGVFSIKLPSFSRVYALLMLNVHPLLHPDRLLASTFPAPLSTIVFDLKGSTVNRAAAARGGNGSLLLDEDVADYFPTGFRLLRPVAAPHDTKSGDLAAAVVGQLASDISILTDANIMDYSLILNVTHLRVHLDAYAGDGVDIVAEAASRLQTLTARTLGMSGVDVPAPVFSTLLAAVRVERQLPADGESHTGPHRIRYGEDLVLLQLGLIDLLQEYDMGKELENRLKCLILALRSPRGVPPPAHVASLPEFQHTRDAGLSAIDAVRYRTRFLRFVQKLFNVREE